MSSHELVVVCYPLTKELTQKLDTLAEFTTTSREACALFAFGLVGLISEYIARGKRGGYIDKVLLVVRTDHGEEVFDGVVHVHVPAHQIAPQRMRIAFPVHTRESDPSAPTTAIADLFGCSTEEVLVYSVVWMADTLIALRTGGSILLRCALGTEFVLYSWEKHREIAGRIGEMLRALEDEGGTVKVEWVWSNI